MEHAGQPNIDALLAELEAAHAVGVRQEALIMEREAELERIKSQEPVAWMTQSGNPVLYKSAEQAVLYGWNPLFLAAGAQSIPAGYQLVPMEPTTAMVSAYLEANKAYWERTDELPKPPHKWRLGTPFDAMINSYKAMLTAAKEQS